MSYLVWVLIAAVAAVVITFVVMALKSKARREEAARDAAQALDAADAALAETAAAQGWALDLKPSPSLWYRIKGASARGLKWEMVEGPPTVIYGDVRGGGVRWSCDDVQAPQLFFEMMPTALYNRMKALASVGEWNGDWSSATKKVIAEGQVVPLSNDWLADRFTVAAITPALAQRLLSPDVQDALANTRSASLRLSFGFPNLRIVCDEGGAQPQFLVKLVEAGAALAHRAREPEQTPE